VLHLFFLLVKGSRRREKSIAWLHRGRSIFFIKNPHSDIANNYTHTQIEALISLFKDIREDAHIAI
jgi:hypothetical protein